MSLRTSALRSEYPIVRCPGCAQPMILTGIEPMVCGNELERVTYTCERCGTRTVRFVKRRQVDDPTKRGVGAYDPHCSAAALAELINAKGIEQKPTPPRQPTLQRPR